MGDIDPAIAVAVALAAQVPIPGPSLRQIFLSPALSLNPCDSWFYMN